MKIMKKTNNRGNRHTAVTVMVCAMACCATLLSGCAGGGHTAPSTGTATSASSSATAKDGTVFTGYYAQQIKRTYDDAHQSLTKKILKDSKITDEEFNELSEHFSDCAKQQGVDVTFDSQGGMQTTYPAGMSQSDGDSAVAQCDEDNDFTSMSILHDSMKSNPKNEDPAVPLLQCLKKNGLAEQSMTVDDYKAIVSDENKDKDVFGKYFDESAPGYDAAKAKLYEACQTNS